MTAKAGPLRVTLLAIPEAAVSTLTGLYDVLNAFPPLTKAEQPPGPPFAVEIAGENAGALKLASGLPLAVERAVDDIAASDIVIVPSVVIGAGGWTEGRYPKLVRWLARMHAGGALLCSAC